MKNKRSIFSNIRMKQAMFKIAFFILFFIIISCKFSPKNNDALQSKNLLGKIFGDTCTIDFPFNIGTVASWSSKDNENFTIRNIDYCKTNNSINSCKQIISYFVLSNVLPGSNTEIITDTLPIVNELRLYEVNCVDKNNQPTITLKKYNGNTLVSNVISWTINPTTKKFEEYPIDSLACVNEDPDEE